MRSLEGSKFGGAFSENSFFPNFGESRVEVTPEVSLACCTIFVVFVDVWRCLTPYFTQFRRYSLIKCTLTKPLFLELGGM